MKRALMRKVNELLSCLLIMCEAFIDIDTLRQTWEESIDEEHQRRYGKAAKLYVKLSIMPGKTRAIHRHLILLSRVTYRAQVEML
jgi:hypothetical protein